MTEMHLRPRSPAHCDSAAPPATSDSRYPPPTITDPSSKVTRTPQSIATHWSRTTRTKCSRTSKFLIRIIIHLYESGLRSVVSGGPAGRPGRHPSVQPCHADRLLAQKCSTARRWQDRRFHGRFACLINMTACPTPAAATRSPAYRSATRRQVGDMYGARTLPRAPGVAQ